MGAAANSPGTAPPRVETFPTTIGLPFPAADAALVNPTTLASRARVTPAMLTDISFRQFARVLTNLLG